MLWTYDSVRKCVNNNYVVLQSVVRNTVKSLGISTDNFDIESFNDNFDIHMLDLKSQDTLGYSLSELLSKFIIAKVDNNVDIAMEKAPYEIESRLREIIDYLRKNPNDSESLEYAKDLINQLREFNRELGVKYSRELDTILSPKPVVRVMSKPEQPKLVEPRTNVVKHNVDNERAKEIENIEYFLKMYIAYARLPQSQSTPYFIEKSKELIDRLRKLDPQLALKYERILNTVLYEKRKYTNYGKKEPRAKVRIRHASVRITEYFNVNETESDKRELVNDVNAVDVDKILRPRSPKPRSVKTDVKITVKRKSGLLQQIRKIMDVIGKDFVNMYYYRS
jgi:polyhydroxyalkanoate synthesis regulator phasin